MADYYSITDIRFFNVYDEQTRELKYSKYNFNFDMYKSDFDIKSDDKLEIFDDFLVRNETAFFNEPDVLNMGEKIPSYLKPTTLKPELEKYFSPMTKLIINYNNKYAQTVHTGYMHVQDPRKYVSITTLVENQFDTVFYKDEEIRRLQDYYYSEEEGIYSKYNFNLEKYSNDFKVYGNHLVVFTDFISRVIYSSGTYPGVYGNGNPRGFKQYFIQSDGLLDYMDKYGTTSVYKNVAYKNEHSIDYRDYAETKNLDPSNLVDVKEHYLRWGQFTQTPLKFFEDNLTTKEENMNSICSIYTSNATGAGFLYKNRNDIGDENIYVITCNHILGKDNLNTFKATFHIVDNSRTNTSTTAEFRVVGRDIFSDIMVGIYDPELVYNKTFNPDLSAYKKLTINLTGNYKIGDEIYTAGNVGNLDNNSLLFGKIMDPKFSGSFLPGATYTPESILMDISGDVGLSGAPIFKNDDDKEVVGMILGGFLDKKYAVSLTSFMLENLITNIIARYAGFSVIYKDNPTMLAINTRKALVRRWLGATSCYYHPKKSIKIHPSLAYFPNASGLILSDFILGFDFVRERFVFDTDTLTRENVTVLEGPLLKSKMYKRFIDTGKTPIVLKSASFVQGWIGQFAKYEFGKFSNQDAFFNFTYGWSAIGSKPVPKGVADNGLVAIMGRIYFEYYYFNGKEWILETEELNDDYDEDFYTVYKDALGNRFYESKWNFPPILLTYESSYINRISHEHSTNMKMLFGDAGQSTGFGDAGRSTGFADPGRSTGFADAGRSTGFADAGRSTGFADPGALAGWKMLFNDKEDFYKMLL